MVDLGGGVFKSASSFKAGSVGDEDTNGGKRQSESRCTGGKYRETTHRCIECTAEKLQKLQKYNKTQNYEGQSFEAFQCLYMT